jgi:hypothetical protein
MTERRRTATGTFTLAIPPHEAFRLFTPTGERVWAHGWDPHFPPPGWSSSGSTAACSATPGCCRA